MPHSEEKSAGVTRRRRILTYWIVGTALPVFYLWVRGAPWLSSETFHTVLEVSATLLAFFVGVLALVRFYSKKNNTVLFLGAGFIGTGLLDGYHAAVTSAYFKVFMPSDLPSLIPWSWVASRQFLAVMLLLSWLGWRREQRAGAACRIPEGWVYAIAAILTTASFLFFAFVPLPAAYYGQLFFHRPEEFVAALIFGVTLWGYLSKGTWAHDSMEHWLIVSLIVGLVAQAVYMSLSSELYDLEFDAAHVLKIVSYVCVLVGLEMRMYEVLTAAEEGHVRIRALVDHAVDGIITIDERGTVESLNPAAEQIFQVSASDIIGSNVKVLMPDPYRAQHDQYLASYLRTGEAKILKCGRTVSGLRSDGTRFPLDLAVSELFLPDGSRRYVGILRDVTDHVGAEAILMERTRELAASNEELEAFTYSVSHDLRGPLRTMSGFAYTLRESYGEVLDDKALDYIHRIIAAGGRMSDLIDGLLSLSKVASADMLVERVDLSELANSLTDELAAQAPDHVVTVQTAPGLFADGDPRLLRVLLRNLLENAWKFTRDVADPQVEVGVKRDGGLDVFYVRDNGIGFDMAHVDGLFTLFQRLHSDVDFEGTGVGLATVERIVRRHGGQVWAEAAVGEGAAIYFTLEEDKTLEP